ncbi:MAG TPA: hypothetical protein VIM71_13885 [Lacunisphaera sp.]
MKLFSRQFLLIAGALLGLAGAGLWFFRPLPAPPKIASDVAPATERPEVAARFEPAARSVASADGARNPPVAAAAIVASPPTPPPSGADRIREWALRDPAEAATWLARAPAGEERDVVLEVVCAEIAQFDPAQAVGFADRYSGVNINLLENLTLQWAEHDEIAAAAYAAGKPPGDTRNRLIGRVAFVRAKTQPAAAAQWVLDQVAPGDIRDEAVLSVLNQWVQRDPGAAAAWLQALPPSALQERVGRELHITIARR